MRGWISVFAGLLATSGMAWAEPCKVAQTATLNVHGEPNGPIVGTLNWPPFRPDTGHNLEGLRLSSSTGLCLTTTNVSN